MRKTGRHIRFAYWKQKECLSIKRLHYEMICVCLYHQVQGKDLILLSECHLYCHEMFQDYNKINRKLKNKAFRAVVLNKYIVLE